MKRLFLLLLLLPILFGHCRQREFTLSISGFVSDSVFGGNLGDVTLVLEMQVLEGGVFNSTFQSVGTASTSDGGHYVFSFERENVIEYRILTLKDGYIDQEFRIDPEDLTPDEVFNLDLEIIPKATFGVHLFSAFPSNEFDSITFKNLAVDFDCICCNSEDRVFVGTEVDTTLSCNLYGESWIKYFVEIEKDTAFHSYIDSLYCPAFEVTTLELPY